MPMPPVPTWNAASYREGIPACVVAQWTSKISSLSIWPPMVTFRNHWKHRSVSFESASQTSREVRICPGAAFLAMLAATWTTLPNKSIRWQ
jgi:hypothetical protein